MAAGKHLSLEEARKQGLLKRFQQEHSAEGDENTFNRLLKVMASGKPAAGTRTSTRGSSED